MRLAPGVAAALAAFAVLLPGGPMQAQAPAVDLEPPVPPSAPSGESATRPGFQPSVLTDKDARTFNFTVPAPRGQILDRHGASLADNIVAYHLGIRFPDFTERPDAEITAFATPLVELARRTIGRDQVADIDPAALVEHARHRRWLPFRLSIRPLDADQLGKASALVAPDASTAETLELETIYLRRYPNGRAASHLLGYVGRRTPLETGEIRDLEILFENVEGRAGLEQVFEGDLAGRDGVLNRTFDGSGRLASQSVVTPPTPGNNLVTTLSLPIQRLAEEMLAEHAKRGALVVMDADAGDLLAVASWPHFDPNDFIPFITSNAFQALNEHPDAPLFGRAFSAAYPPGSTFKPFVACALLERGPVTPFTLYDGVPSLTIEGRPFRNWNDSPEGPLDVVGALARSCNTWFYQAAIDTGSAPIVQTARLFGFGAATGLPIPGEAPGSLPDEHLFRQATANLAIGQGEVLATPVQITAAIAAIGNGRRFVKPRLALQVQDFRNNVIKQFRSDSQGYLPFAANTLNAVQLGMDEVVNSGRGTAKSARRDHPAIAGKTGTAQWSAGDGRLRHLALFTGFTFSANPRLAFVAVYEGSPGESGVGGSAKAAPIIRDFLERLYSDHEKYQLPVPSETARPIPFEPEGSPWGEYGSGSGIPTAGAAPYPAPAPLPPPPEPARPTFWQRIFGR